MKVGMVSFVIPVLNNKVRLEHCLESIRSQQTGSEVEIVVIDNGSSDGSAELAATIADKSEVEISTRSPYACRNRGVGISAGRLIVLLDSNVVLVSSQWLEKVLAAYKVERFDVGVPRFEFEFRNPIRPSLEEFYSSIRHADSERDVAQGGAGGACLVCERSVFEKVGLFPVQRSNGDSIWTRAVTDAGGKLSYLPDAVCRYPAKSGIEQMRTELRIGYGNRQRWLSKGDGRFLIALRSLRHMLPQSPGWLKALVERRAPPNLPQPPFAKLWLFAWKMRMFRGLGRLGVRRFGTIIAD
jgi:glycosyltransferase involved in cell wall biosynthesis